MYTCSKCGEILGSAASIGNVYGENPKEVYCPKCKNYLSINLPYSPPLNRQVVLSIILGLFSTIELFSGFFIMSHVWKSINNTFLAFLGAAGIVILTLVIFIVSIYITFDKPKNPYAHGYNSSFSMAKRMQLENERLGLLISFCVVNGIFIVISYFTAIRHLF